MERIKLLKVHYLPKELEEGFLYVSKEFGVAGHLCPCGCKNKIITPLDLAEWSFKEVNNKPTLYPSIGNWQLPCKSHYWIIDGKIVWSYQWSEEQIKEGGEAEEEKRKSYYYNLENKYNKQSLFKRFIKFVFGK
ncbi:DUF6527 family protein [Labilibaculum antarcticum]|uniref:Uncharacterized protein n=1 Tax=Labilibaculum antarcticum TaxID=1717717 RepID=A0A1Y1CNA1_9BACT|nr:DUF6527 family protein [Labilibaculum antarcticum]BAX81754.1 hypothetical protein ALGA_3456 [Labilibaculum antarcticum]